MLITFRTPRAPTLTLFGEHAIALLEAMGQSGAVPGALMHADVGPALERLRVALEGETGQVRTRSPGAGPDEPSVSLANRGRPLVDLFERAARTGSDIVWSAGG
jgi:hypothetical protein